MNDMYEILEKNKAPLLDENIFYTSETSKIYKVEDILYKVYLKKEPYKRHILDYLIKNYDELKPYSTPPISKLKLEDNYGMKMNFIESTDFLTYLKSNNDNPNEIIRIIKILSNNLKSINNLSIHFSDLHHHNILIREDGYPLYTDLDDASVKDYGSTHICVLAHRLHNVKEKGYDYEDALIKYGNLDQECLTLMLLNYMMNSSMEKLSYDEFNRKIERISPYFENDFMTALSRIKDKDDNLIINPYPYYIGDYMNSDKFVESFQKVQRRFAHENSSVSSHK